MSKQSAVIKAALILVLNTEEKPYPSLENMAAIMMNNSIIRHFYQPLSKKNTKINDRILRQMAKAGVNDGLRADIDSMVNTSGVLSSFDGNVLIKECNVLHKSICSILEDIHAQPVSIKILKG